MICIGVMLCLSTDLAKNDKIMSMFVPFSGFFGYFESLAFFPKWGGGGGADLTPKQSNMIF